MFAALSNSLRNAVNKLNEGNINQNTLQEFLDSVSDALKDSDVAVDVVKEIIENVRVRAETVITGERRKSKHSVRDTVLKCLANELIRILMSPQKVRFEPKKRKVSVKKVKDPPSVVMFIGLQGAGKTSSLSKYGLYYKARGLNVGVICCDTYRAGAYQQLQTNCSACKLAFYGEKNSLDETQIALNGLKQFASKDLILIDTSGRHRKLVNTGPRGDDAEDIVQMIKIVKPSACVYVMDSHIGQSCVDQIEGGYKPYINSFILTKVDSTAKAGAAITCVVAAKAPVGFVTTGERFDDIELFNPKAFVAKILNLPNELEAAIMRGGRSRMTLLDENDVNEQAKAKRKQKKTIKRMTKGQMTYEDMRGQLESMTNMANLGPIMDMVGKGLGGLGGFDSSMMGAAMSEFKVCLYMIDSMTLDERMCIVPLTDERKERIAQGAGCQLVYVDILINLHKGLSKTFSKIGKSTKAPKIKRIRP